MHLTAVNILAGTRTSQALQYVNDVILTEENGDRPNAQNVLIVITDGTAQDGDLLRAATNNLRSQDVIVRIQYSILYCNVCPVKTKNFLVFNKNTLHPKIKVYFEPLELQCAYKTHYQ